MGWISATATAGWCYWITIEYELRKLLGLAVRFLQKIVITVLGSNGPGRRLIVLCLNTIMVVSTFARSLFVEASGL
jgi:hypothetical protein